MAFSRWLTNLTAAMRRRARRNHAKRRRREDDIYPSFYITPLEQRRVLNVGPVTDGDSAVNTVAEDAAATTVVGVMAQATDSDESDTVTYSLTDDAGGLFTIHTNSGVVTVAGVLDAETATSHTITVEATSSDTSTSTADFMITVTDVDDNDPIFGAANYPASVAEDIAETVVIATVAATDADVNSGVTYSITGGNTGGLFEVNAPGEVSLASGKSLDAETTTSHELTVTAGETDGTAADTATVTIQISNVNDVAPTVDLSNTVTTLAEDAATTPRVKVADIAVTDDGLGTNDLSLSGADAGLFEIDGTELYLKAGTALDFETNPVLDVTVAVDDAALGGTPDDTAVLEIQISNVNDVAPTVDLSNTVTTLAEDAATTPRVKVADIVVTDDGLGTNDLSLSGADAGLFEIDGTELYLKAGTALDFETNPVLDVTVAVDDAALGGTPDDTAVLEIQISNVNDVAPTVDLSNTVTTLAEDAAMTPRVKVADIVVTDDGLGTNDLSLSGKDAGLFEIDGTELYLKAGTALDFETNPVLDVTVAVDDAALGGTPDDTAVLEIQISNVNDVAPTVDLSNTVTTLAEDAATTPRVKVADIVVTDDGLGTNDLSLSGADAGLFEIDGTELYLKAGTALDFETNPVLDVTVAVDDAALGGTPDDTAVLEIQISNVNDVAPTVDLSNTVTTLAEDAATTPRVKVADIVVTDDGLGTNDLSLSGADAGLFEIDGTELYLKAGTALDFETNPVLDVTVAVDDAALGGTPDDTAVLEIQISNVNDVAPTVDLSNTVTTLAEDAATTPRVKVADIVVTDDGLGTNDLSLSGADAGLFEIDGTELYLKAGTALDFETNPVLDVTVAVDDAALGGTPDDTAVLEIQISNVNDVAPTVDLSNTVTTLAEDAATTPRVKVADIVVTDDGLGTNDLSLSGADAGLFEIDGTELYLKAGTALDFETNPVLDVTVAVDDAALGGTPDDTAVLEIQISNVNDVAPTVDLSNTVTTLAEDAATTPRVKVADIVVTDDGLGTNDLSLSGADAGLFEIDGTELYLKAGTALDFETNPVLDVTVAVDDAALGGTPDDTAVLEIQISNVNDVAPTVDLSNTVTTLAEDAATTPRVKVADIVVTDDGLGTNDLSLSGADAGLFEIDGTELYLKAGTALDFETNPVLDVTVAVDDAALGGTPDDTAGLTITVTDVNEAPTITTGASVSVEENQTAVVDVESFDPDGETEGSGLTYSLTGGPDQSAFSIAAATGVLTFDTAPDFENPTDNDGDNVYDVQITVTDAGGLTDVLDLAVTVTDANEAPTITTGAAVNAAENQIVVVDVESTDPDGETEGSGLTYSLTGGLDQSAFSIVAAAGVLTFNTAPDFENPTDNDGDNVYDVQITVTDAGGLTDVLDLAVTVTGVNDAPTIDGATNPAEINEVSGDSSAQNIAAVAGTIDITDQDVGDTLNVTVIGEAMAAYNDGDLPDSVDVSALIASGAISFDALTSDGDQQRINWTYDPEVADLDWLQAGDTLILTYVAQVDDGAGNVGSQDLVITIKGTNDVPTIDGATNPAEINEVAGDSSAQNIAAVSGTIDITDQDVGDTLTVTVTEDATTRYSYGDLPDSVDVSALIASGAISFDALTSDGDQQRINWTYDPEVADLDWLQAGDTLILTYVAQVDDGAGNVGSQDLVITIKGTNDVPTIDGATNPAEINEVAGDSSAQNIAAVSGTVDITDQDLGDTLTVTVTEDATPRYNDGDLPDSVDVSALIASDAISFDALTSDGDQQRINWRYDPEVADLDWLQAGDTLILTYVAQVDDGAGNVGSQDLVITITGTNDPVSFELPPLQTVDPLDKSVNVVLQNVDAGAGSEMDDLWLKVTGPSWFSSIESGVISYEDWSKNGIDFMISDIPFENQQADFTVSLFDVDPNAEPAPVPAEKSLTIPIVVSAIPSSQTFSIELPEIVAAPGIQTEFALPQRTLQQPMMPMWEDSPAVDTTAGEVQYIVVVEMVTEFNEDGSPQWNTVLELKGKKYLRDLPGLLKRLPDDRYRIYLEEKKGEETLEKRLIREVLIRDGKPTEQVESSMVDETTGAGPNQAPHTIQRLEDQPASPPTLDATPAPGATTAPTDEPDVEPNAAPEESGVREAAAAMVAAPLVGTVWQDRIDQAISEHSQRLLTKAARIYRRTDRNPKRKA